MAKIGFEYVVAAVLKSGDSAANAAYEKGIYLGPSSAFNGTPTVSDASDYGDDKKQESDRSVTGGKLSLELNEKTPEAYALLTGATKSEDGSIISNTETVPPYVGIGCVGKSIVNGVKKYLVKWYYKVQFGEPNDENATKQENVSFTHTTLEGNISPLSNGDWKKEVPCDTLAAAKTALEKLAGITVAGG